MQVILNSTAPLVAASAWIAPNATLVGNVHVGERSSIWYGAVLRAESEAISIGSGTNVQDCCVLHVDPGYPATLGDGVSVGHGAVLHGCTIENDVLVGMGATVLNGARVGAGSLIAAGALLLEGADIPAGSLVAGVPGKVRRELRPEEIEHVRTNAATYIGLAAIHAVAVRR